MADKGYRLVRGVGAQFRVLESMPTLASDQEAREWRERRWGNDHRVRLQKATVEGWAAVSRRVPAAPQFNAHGTPVDEDGVPTVDSEADAALARAAARQVRDAAPDLLRELKLAHRALVNLGAYLRKHEAALPPMSLASLDLQVESAAAAIAQAEGR